MTALEVRVLQGPAKSSTTGRGTKCCGDPEDMDGGAHPWEWVGDDTIYDYYECPECGATDRE